MARRFIQLILNKNSSFQTMLDELALRLYALCAKIDFRVRRLCQDSGAFTGRLVCQPNCCERTSLFPKYGSKDHSSGNDAALSRQGSAFQSKNSSNQRLISAIQHSSEAQEYFGNRRQLIGFEECSYQKNCKSCMKSE